MQRLLRVPKRLYGTDRMGVFENPTLAAGTIAVAKALAETDATTIIVAVIPQQQLISSALQIR